MMDDNLVSCMMMTGGNPDRMALTRCAILSFMTQTWKPRELIIVNQSKGLGHEAALMPWVQSEFDRVPEGVDVREIHISRPPTLGEMRNIAVENAKGGWLLPWDDDDWHHEDRCARMMNMRKDGFAIIPTCHVRYSLPQNTAFRYYNPGGCGGIGLFPNYPGARYRPLDKEEDSRFVEDFHPRRVLWDNRGFAHIYIRFYHGNNIGSEPHIMKQFRGKQFRSRWMDDPTNPGYLCREEVAYLKQVLRERYRRDFPNGIPWHGKE